VYYYEILRATWLTALGSTILWQVKITDNDNDRSGDSLTKTSSIKTGGTVSDDDTGPPTIMSYDDDGDIIDSDATTYQLQVDVTDYSGFASVQFNFSLDNGASWSGWSDYTTNSSNV
jgi:hypothetical protein